MATQYIEFTGKALWAQVWPEQIDMGYPDEKRGGNYSVKLIVDDDTLKLFNALGSKAKAKRISDIVDDLEQKGKKIDGIEPYLANRLLTFRRYERLSSGSPLGPVEVVGVDPGTSIGNYSDVTVTTEVYTTEYQNKPVVGIRMVSVRVNELVKYVKPEPIASDNTPPVH